ncbi:MAG TPA: hypothetical protein VE974_06975 [Thermoanaerobaculia bacterium]|nr:hypothetical protein [Thermoanaerobaculia bacterium]
MKKTLDPAPSPHAEAARVLLEKIRALQDEFPRVAPVAPELTRRLVAKAKLPEAGIEATTVEIERSPRLATAAAADAPSLRDSYAYAIAYGPVVKELLAVARTVTHTIRVERARAGAVALDVYAIATRLSKQEDGAEFLPYVETIREMLKQKRGRKTTSSPDSASLVPSAPSK